jgi:hypothetical protein
VIAHLTGEQVMAAHPVVNLSHLALSTRMLLP